MKQHPDSVNRDLDDEVAEVIEHQYARRMVQPTKRGASAASADPKSATDTDSPQEHEKPRQT